MGIVYDFDGTLAPGNMQEHQFIPILGMSSEEFWEDVGRLAVEQQADQILAYMRLMLLKAAQLNVPLRRSDFRNFGAGIELFSGVQDWFDRISEYGRESSVKIEHYLVSSGNDEIIAGTPIASKFNKVYASRFMFDEYDAPVWPALAINYTTKTQYLFRINKNAHDLNDNGDKINEFVRKEDRPIPFENMVYIGDGSTDVPCFRLVKDQGGLSIVVFKPHTSGARKRVEKYLNEGRVHRVAPANYDEGKDLDNIIKANIDNVGSRARLSQLMGA